MFIILVNECSAFFVPFLEKGSVFQAFCMPDKIKSSHLHLSRPGLSFSRSQSLANLNQALVQKLVQLQDPESGMSYNSKLGKT